MNGKKSLVTIVAFGLFVFLLMVNQTAVCAEAGSGTTENTKPALEITNQTGIKVVVQINYTDTMPNGMSKQAMAVKNLYDQYTALGMKPGKDYEIVMVFRADGAQFLLTDEAYDLKVKKPHPKGNPNKAMIEAMHKGGVKKYECHVAMKLKGYKPEDIFPFSRVVVSGIGAVVDFEKSGYMEITP
jgi:intracellular sulfur oxidation DsrE/DsrF family protein